MRGKADTQVTMLFKWFLDLNIIGPAFDASTFLRIRMVKV